MFSTKAMFLIKNLVLPKNHVYPKKITNNHFSTKSIFSPKPWFHLNLVFTKNHVFPKKTCFHQKSCFHQKNKKNRFTFSQKVDQISFEWKCLCFFLFFFHPHFNNFLVTHGHTPAIFNFLDLILSELSHSPSPWHSKTYLQSMETKTGTNFILWQS